jgi:hypothetical protein
VHWYRNIFIHVPSTKVREIAAMLKAIHAGEDIVAAQQKAVQVIEKMRGLPPGQCSRACGNGGRGDTGPLRLSGGALAAHPNQQSARTHSARDQAKNPRRRLVPGWAIGTQSRRSQLRHIAGTAWSTKRYLNIELQCREEETGDLCFLFFFRKRRKFLPARRSSFSNAKRT